MFKILDFFRNSVLNYSYLHRSNIKSFQTLCLFSLIIASFISNHVNASLEQNSSDFSKEMLLNEPSSFVNHSVNVITGDYHESEIDIEVAGPHPLFFQRSYISSQYGGNLCDKWSTNHHGTVSIYDKIHDPERRSTARVKGDCGSNLVYEGVFPKKNKNVTAIHTVKEKTFQKYITNCPDLSFSPGSHIRNNRLIFAKNDEIMDLVSEDGYKRHYKREKHHDFVMGYEDQPNGCVFCYEVDQRKKSDSFTKKISLQNQERQDLSSFSIGFVDDHLRTISSIDGKWVNYAYEPSSNYKNDQQYYLKTVEGSDIPTQTYEYSASKAYKFPKITCKNLPEGRFLRTEYYKEKKNKNGNDEINLKPLDPKIGRVMLQKAPVGIDDSPIITHRYFYQLREHIQDNIRTALGGLTTVYDAHNNKMDYHFNDDYRLTDIWKWMTGNQHLYSSERLFWAANETSNSTNLMSRILLNGQNEVKLCRSYLYDHKGNPIQKTLWGNLTGKQTGNIILDGNGIPIPHTCECFTKSFTYSAGNPNLLTKESDGKKVIEYFYHPNTNLNTTRLVKVGDQINKREFNLYDENGCVVLITLDDGISLYENDHTSITERRLTSLVNRTEAPIGLPQIIDQKYVDYETNEHVLIGRVVNTHSPKGKLLSQEHYDSEGVLKFTLEWEYDSMGNMTVEKDALQRVITRKYDKNKNLIYEEGPHPGVYKEFRYDFVNRLIGTTEVHPDGIRFISSFRYDLLGNKIASIDPYGQETRYIYDHQNRLIQTIFQVVLNENMIAVQPTARVEYDLFDNPCRLIDADGGVTVISYTVHNKPYHKVYPDGSTETFEYDLSGNLVMSIAQNGTKTLYQYDPFDRLIKQEMYSAAGDFLQKESNVYNTFHLLSKTDPEGMITYYEYDKAGRLFKVIKGEMCTQYEYDTLGRIFKELTFYGNEKDDYTAKVREYDLLNRMIEERLEDSYGNILTKETYEYDFSGNCHVSCKFNQAGQSLTYTEYNTRGQVISITNALGDQTHIHYRYDYYDEELNQNLPYSETIDPQGVVTIRIQDALGRNKTKSKKDPFGKLLQKTDYYYTQQGLLSRTVEQGIVDKTSQREIVNSCKYNLAGKVIETCEAEGSHKQKITRFSYNSYGQKESEIKPDGTVLHYDYDALGRLKVYYASDKSFHYVFEYDLNNNPIHVLDKIHETQTLKIYDEYNRLWKETLANGLSLEYSYDLSGKPTQIIFPDGSGMGLSYDNLLLKEVFRINQQGEKIYTHSYNCYDLSGNVTESTLIEKAGKVNYTIDLKGRIKGISHDRWSGSILSFDTNGNVKNKTSQDELGSYSSQFNYDELNQLIEETGNFQEKYVCDSLYNRIRKGSSDYELNDLNQINHDGKNEYKYDLNGNLIEIKNANSEIKFFYDGLNRLITVEKGDRKIAYIYDEMNRRISKTISILNDSHYVLDQSFQYFYQGLNEIGCYEDGKLTELRLLGIGKGAEIGAAIAMEFNNIVYAPMHDLHGNVICLIEADTGKIKEFYRYSAFGEEALYDQNSTSIQTAINSWRFSSKRTDSETGFVYFGRRYYDSSLGRWITADPIGFEGGPNLYAYVMNNPLTNLDLYGLYAVNSLNAARNERSCLSNVRDFISSAYEGIRDCLSSVYRSFREGLSRAAFNLSERFSSCKEKRQIRFNPRILASAMNRLAPSTSIVGEGEYKALGYTNGVNNTTIQNQSSAEIISKIAGGSQVASTINPTNHLIHDIFRAFHSLVFNLASNVVPELHKKWDAHFEKYGSQSVWMETCHSEGAINVRNALMCYNPELRKSINVLAIAPACYIDARLCKSVHHYVSARDFVPCLDIKGRIRNQETVHVLSPEKGANFWDHDFQSPTYSKAIDDHIQQHLKNTGY